ncbi:MFS transporter [Parahaliea maris]|uniref:MFS transporter n=1 Tax=Parahaliea maris TaxID=2716870 RepID=A0A5C9A9Z2_9GAMM|nr:MFS transporter [Parahaliea maris]TXS96417.1 MFS transporter [Parahaliea maris]
MQTLQSLPVRDRAPDDSRRFLGVDLSDGIGKRHLLAYLLLALISSSYAGAMSLLQSGLLQVMGFAAERQATITGMLGALQEIVLILLLAPVGAIADRIGRRPVYVFGMLVTAIGFALYPWADSLSQLVLFRIVVSVGGAAVLGMMVTVIADYSRDNTRGRANGLQGLLATLGAFIPPALASLPHTLVAGGASERVAQQMTFGAAAALGVLGALIAWRGLAEIHGAHDGKARKPLPEALREGFSAARDPGIALSYGAAFISRGDLAITGAFISLWLVQYGVTELGMAPSAAMYELAVPRMLATVVGALVGSVLMGYISDRISRVRAVTLASGLAALVYLAVLCVGNPSETWVMGLLFVMGIAEISAFVSSQALVGERAPAAQRGTVIGFFGVTGALGILVGTAGGGWLFATFMPAAPFALFGALNALVCLWSLGVSTHATPAPARAPNT